MSIFLNESEVARLLTMPLAVEAVEKAHRELSLGNAIDIPRQRTRVPKTALHILQGALLGDDAVGYKAYTSNRSGNRFLVHVFSASGGHLRVVVEANLLGMVRTGAASAVATRWLARPDAEVLGVFGAGWQAEGNIEAISTVRSLKKVKVFARSADKLADFCAKMTKRLNLEVVPASSAEETVRGSDILTTITTAATPLFKAEWLEPGTHINAAGSNAIIRCEIGEDVLKRCSRIFVDSLDTALKEAGDLIPLLEKGRLSERQLVELGDVIIGRQAGRGSADEITIFESQGLAIQDLAVAVRLEELARQQNLGVTLPYGR